MARIVFTSLIFQLNIHSLIDDVIVEGALLSFNTKHIGNISVELRLSTQFCAIPIVL